MRLGETSWREEEVGRDMLSIAIGFLVSDGRLSKGMDVMTPAVGAKVLGSISWVMSTD